MVIGISWPARTFLSLDLSTSLNRLRYQVTGRGLGRSIGDQASLLVLDGGLSQMGV